MLEVAEGKFSVQARMMLDVQILRGGEIVFSSHALNEAVVAVWRADPSGAFGDGREITSFSGTASSSPLPRLHGLFHGRGGPTWSRIPIALSSRPSVPSVWPPAP